MLALAVRNLFRHRTRSMVALSAIVFSTIALVLAGGFIEWIFWAMREGATDAGMGHVQVMRPGFLVNGAADPLAFVLPENSVELSEIRRSPHVKAVSPRIEMTGLISHNETTLAFLGTGVDVERESVVSGNLTFVAGRNLRPDDPDSVVLGEGLARQLGVGVGEPVALLYSKKRGGLSGRQVVVRGIFATKVKAVDDIGLRIPIELARRLMQVSGSHEWVLLFDNAEVVDDQLQALKSQFDPAQLSFVSWTELSDFYVKTVNLLNSQLSVVRLMISLIIILGISNMLIMNVLERTGEVGTLMALGTTRMGILRLFVAEGFLLGLLGTGVGLIVAYVLARAISAVGIPMPPPPGRTLGYSAELLVTWPLVVTTYCVVFGTTLLASFYPAWKASRLVIVDALRHNR